MAARRLRSVFFGSSDFSVPILERLLENHEVVAVVSQPDKPAGRGLALTATPVTTLARTHARKVFTPQRLDADVIASIAHLRPELLACASYGKILPAAMLAAPELGALNVHPSMLPQYRGATPIQSALRDGRAQTGVTVFWMTARMDAGDIALAREVRIGSSDNYGTLHDRLAHVGAELLVDAAELLANGRLTRSPQREVDATYCKPLSKEDLRLRFDAPARSIVDHIRSVAPAPAAWMLFDGKRLKVLQAEAIESPSPGAPPGTIVEGGGAGPVVAATEGAIRLLRVIPEGKPPMAGADFAKSLAQRR